jgi:hypothetical protein
MRANAIICMPPKLQRKAFQKTIWQRNYRVEWQPKMPKNLHCFDRNCGKQSGKERLQDKGSASGAPLSTCLHIVFYGGFPVATGGRHRRPALATEKGCPA